MRGKVVAISIGILFLLSVLIPQFVDISPERLPEDDREYVDLKDIDLKALNVNESHVGIQFFTSIQRSETLSNTTLIISIYDSRTELLLTETEVKPPEKGQEGLAQLNTTISLEKDKDYSIVFRVNKDREIVDSKRMVLRGLTSLVPQDKELKFSMKDVDFEIVRVRDDSATVLTRFYVDSMKDYTDTTFHIKAIQYESNVLADDKWLEMDVDKGKTVLVESNLTVPRDYNYVVKLEAWRQDSLLKTWSKGLNLAPTKKVPQNVTEEKVRFEIEEFARQTPTPAPVPTSTPREIPETAMPGFEIILALFALGGVLLWKKKR